LPNSASNAAQLSLLRFVVYLRVRRAPAVQRAFVHFDLRGQIRFREMFAQHILRVGCFSSSFAAIANRYDAFIFGTSRCGLSGLSVTSPPPWNDAPAPTRFGNRSAVRIVSGPPMQ
jgi:hypothetical protein